MLAHCINNGLHVKILATSTTTINQYMQECTEREIAVVAHFICRLVILIPCLNLGSLSM